jgi:hypothetical protein
MPAAAFELRDQLGEIVIDNPPLNLFSEGLIADLRTAAERAAVSEARAVLLRAKGDAFSAGADVSIFTGLDEAEAEALMSAALSLIAAIEEIPVPTLALVHGRCFAGALEVALACDLIWAAAGTVVGQVEAVIGAFPFAGGTQRLASPDRRRQDRSAGLRRIDPPCAGARGLGIDQSCDRSCGSGSGRSGIRDAAGERPDSRSPRDQAHPPRLALRRRGRRRPDDAFQRPPRDPQQRPAEWHREPPALGPWARHLRQLLKGRK